MRKELEALPFLVLVAIPFLFGYFAPRDHFVLVSYVGALFFGGIGGSITKMIVDRIKR